MFMQLTERIDGVYLADGTSLIQAFVMMTTFLTGYNLLLYSKKYELGIDVLPLCIIKRVVRCVYSSHSILSMYYIRVEPSSTNHHHQPE